MHPINNFTEWTCAFGSLLDKPNINISIDPPAAVFIVAQLQLALRHPENKGEAQEIAHQFAVGIQKALTELEPKIESFLEQGWHIENDVPIKPTTPPPVDSSKGGKPEKFRDLNSDLQLEIAANVIMMRLIMNFVVQETSGTLSEKEITDMFTDRALDIVSGFTKDDLLEFMTELDRHRPVST